MMRQHGGQRCRKRAKPGISSRLHCGLASYCCCNTSSSVAVTVRVLRGNRANRNREFKRTGEGQVSDSIKKGERITQMCKNLHRREHDLCARLDKEKQNMWDVVGVHRGVQGSHICGDSLSPWQQEERF